MSAESQEVIIRHMERKNQLLKQQLIETTYQLHCMNCSASHAVSCIEPRSNHTKIQIRTNLSVLNMTIEDVKRHLGEE